MRDRTPITKRRACWLALGATAAALLAGTGCATQYPSGTGSVDGLLGGSAFQVRDVVFGISPADTSALGGQPAYLMIKLTSFANACQVATEQIEPSSSGWLTLAFALDSGLPAAGTYTIGASGSAFSAEYDSFDASCSRNSSSFSTGTITITQASVSGGSEHVAGKLAATFQLGEGDPITGELQAAPCDRGWYIGGGGNCQTP